MNGESSDVEGFGPGGGSLGPMFFSLPKWVRTFDDLMDFDRMKCRTHPAFVRPVHPAEPNPTRQEVNFVSVRQVRPGFRIRVGLHLHPGGLN